MSDQPLNDPEGKLAVSSNGNTSNLQNLSESQGDTDTINLDQFKNLPPLPQVEQQAVTIPVLNPTLNDLDTEKSGEPAKDQVAEPERLKEQIEINEFNRKTGALQNSQLELNQDISASLENDLAITYETDRASPIEFDAQDENIELDVNQTEEDYTVMDPNHVTLFS